MLVHTFCSRVGLGIWGARFPLLCDIWCPLEGLLLCEALGVGPLDWGTCDDDGPGWDMSCFVVFLSSVSGLFELSSSFAALCPLLTASDGAASTMIELNRAGLGFGDTFTGDGCLGIVFTGELGFTKMKWIQMIIWVAIIYYRIMPNKGTLARLTDSLETKTQCTKIRWLYMLECYISPLGLQKIWFLRIFHRS